MGDQVAQFLVLDLEPIERVSQRDRFPAAPVVPSLEGGVVLLQQAVPPLHLRQLVSQARVRGVEALERDGEIRNAEFQLQRIDGTTLTVIESARAVKDEHGNLIGYEGTISDISERKRAETAVFEEKEKAQVTLQSIGDAVITTDAAGRIEYLNPVAEDLTGWDSNEAQGRSLREVFSIVGEEGRAPAESPVERVIRENTVVGLANHTLLLRRDGTEIAIDDSAAPIRDVHGELVGVVLVFRDVTERRREEQ